MANPAGRSTVGMTGAALTRRAAALWRRARRNRWLAHLVRAGVRYDQADGGRLVAAITYYAFFATFALTLLGFAVFGFVLDTPAVAASVQRYITQTLPRLDVQSLRHARGTVGIIAFVGLPVTGWFWVDALRSSIRRIWQLPEYPGALLVRVLVDLLVLAGLGLLLTTSLAVAFGTTSPGRPAGHHPRRGSRPGPVAAGHPRTPGRTRGERPAVHRSAHRAAPAPDAASPGAGTCPAGRARPGGAQDPSAGSTSNTRRPTPPTRSWPAPSAYWSSSTWSTNSYCSPPR